MLAFDHLQCADNVADWHVECLSLLERAALSAGLADLRLDSLVTFPLCEHATISGVRCDGVRVSASALLSFMRRPGRWRDEEVELFGDDIRRGAA